MLFLGFGTGLGTTLIVDGTLVPMELAHLPYKKATFEDYVGEEAQERDGKKKWRKHCYDVIVRLIAALEPEDVVIGGGNSVNLTELPPRCRLGANANAFPGGMRLWDDQAAKKPRKQPKRAARTRR
jgi:polyphosphate glucokinase